MKLILFVISSLLLLSVRVLGQTRKHSHSIPNQDSYQPASNSCRIFHLAVSRESYECERNYMGNLRQFCSYECEGDGQLQLFNCHKHKSGVSALPLCSDLYCKSFYEDDLYHELPVEHHHGQPTPHSESQTEPPAPPPASG